MPAVKQFDRKEVLDRAMRVFWERGYDATSIQNLVEATGINRASLYATFGGKKELFLNSLLRYEEVVVEPLFAALDDPNPRRAIERMFAGIVRRVGDPAYPRGCFYTNTSLECPVGGNAIGRAVAEFFQRQESALYRTIRRAQAHGVIDSRRNARALARFFQGVAHGLNVVNKANPDPAILHDAVRVAMSVWDTGHAHPDDRPRPKLSIVKR
jgi:TetR/AcrR family transcriptional regulator, transcriptional repressor for nem operon